VSGMLFGRAFSIVMDFWEIRLETTRSGVGWQEYTRRPAQKFVIEASIERKETLVHIHKKLIGMPRVMSHLRPEIPNFAANFDSGLGNRTLRIFGTA
jgi:hypothetical protein